MSLLFIAAAFVANYFVYQKMGREGWEGIIPFYCNYVMFEVLYGNGWKFLTMLIPIYNIYVIIKLSFDIAKAFGKPTGFGFGLLLLSPIFLLILGFDSSTQFIGLAGRKAADE